MSAETDFAAALAAFDYQPRTRVVFGVNSIEQVGELAKSLAAKRVLLVTDPGIVAAGHAGRVAPCWSTAGMHVTCFDQVRENPTTRCVERCVEVARGADIDTIVGLGGGSSMDTAKGCNFILTNGGQMKDYWGVGNATRPMLPLHRHPHDRRHGQRMPVLCPHRRRADPSEDGLRRPESRRAHCPP